MKTALIFILAGLIGFANAEPQAGKHDLDFTAKPVHQVKRVEWIVTDNVDEVCQGFAPLNANRQYIACTKFNNNSCIVYTKPNLTLSQLGHEMRHCFEGHWHN